MSQLKGKGNWIVKFFVIKVEKEGRFLVFGILVLVLLWFLTRNEIYLNLFAYDSFFLKIFVWAILTRMKIHQMSMNFCIELNGKEPKNIQLMKIEYDAWYVVFILRLNWSILMIGCQSLWIKQIWMQKLMLKDFWNS